MKLEPTEVSEEEILVLPRLPRQFGIEKVEYGSAGQNRTASLKSFLNFPVIVVLEMVMAFEKVIWSIFFKLTLEFSLIPQNSENSLKHMMVFRVDVFDGNSLPVAMA